MTATKAVLSKGLRWGWEMGVKRGVSALNRSGVFTLQPSSKGRRKRNRNLSSRNFFVKREVKRGQTDDVNSPVKPLNVCWYRLHRATFGWYEFYELQRARSVLAHTNHVTSCTNHSLANETTRFLKSNCLSPPKKKKLTQNAVNRPCCIRLSYAFAD